MWNLPAHASCPGESEVCMELCYADKGNFATHMAKYFRNFAECQEPGWARLVVEDIQECSRKTKRRKNPPRYCRIHSSGDFFSLQYIYRWLYIVRSCPRVQFFAFTRSWNVPTLLPALIELSQLPNMELWWSTDSSMPEPPYIPGVRVSYLSQNDDDVPLYFANKTFRDENKRGRGLSPAKTLGPFASPICPLGQHISPIVRKTVSCGTCGLCCDPATPKEEAAAAAARHAVSREFVPLEILR